MECKRCGKRYYTQALSARCTGTQTFWDWGERAEHLSEGEVKLCDVTPPAVSSIESRSGSRVHPREGASAQKWRFSCPSIPFSPLAETRQGARDDNNRRYPLAVVVESEAQHRHTLLATPHDCYLTLRWQAAMVCDLHPTQNFLSSHTGSACVQ